MPFTDLEPTVPNMNVNDSVASQQSGNDNLNLTPGMLVVAFNSLTFFVFLATLLIQNYSSTMSLFFSI